MSWTLQQLYPIIQRLIFVLYSKKTSNVPPKILSYQPLRSNQVALQISNDPPLPHRRRKTQKNCRTKNASQQTQRHKSSKPKSSMSVQPINPPPLRRHPFRIDQRSKSCPKRRWTLWPVKSARSSWAPSWSSFGIWSCTTSRWHWCRQSRLKRKSQRPPHHTQCRWRKPHPIDRQRLRHYQHHHQLHQH